MCVRVNFVGKFDGKKDALHLKNISEGMGNVGRQAHFGDGWSEM